MKLIKNLVLGSMLIFGFALAIAGPSAEAQLFKGAKKEACEGATAGSGNCDRRDAASSLENTITDIINLVTIVVGIVAVIMIIINGFRFITSGGDSNTVSSARNGLIYAIVGLIIVVLAQVIVRFVLGTAT